MKLPVILSLITLVLGFFIFNISHVQGLSTDLRSSYQQLETAIVEIKPIVGPMSSDNIEFKRGHVLVPFEYDVLKLGSKYFLYFITPQQENNYTLVLKDITTIVDGQVQVITMEQNFSTQSFKADYNIKPGAILTQTDFNVLVTLNNDSEELINTGYQNSMSSIFLHPGENNIHFSLNDFQPGFSQFSIGSYLVPIYAVKQGDFEPVYQGPIIFLPGRINERFYPSSSKVISFKIINVGNKSLSNLQFNYNSDKFIISPSKITKIDVNQSLDFN